MSTRVMPTDLNASLLPMAPHLRGIQEVIGRLEVAIERGDNETIEFLTIIALDLFNFSGLWGVLVDFTSVFGDEHNMAFLIQYPSLQGDFRKAIHAGVTALGIDDQDETHPVPDEPVVSDPFKPDYRDDEPDEETPLTEEETLLFSDFEEWARSFLDHDHE
jgi:hypothetical protein